MYLRTLCGTVTEFSHVKDKPGKHYMREDSGWQNRDCTVNFLESADFLRVHELRFGSTELE